MERTQLTNQQVIEHVQALDEFNPSKVTYRTTLRLARNLRQLNKAAAEYEHARQRLFLKAAKDQTKAPPQGQQMALTPEEQQSFSVEHQKLLKEEVEVEIHPIEVINSIEGQAPEDPEHFIDIADQPVRNRIRATLLDTVFVEWKGKRRIEPVSA